MAHAGRLNGGLSTAAAAAADSSGRGGALLRAASSAEGTMRSANSSAFSEVTATSANLWDAAFAQSDGSQVVAQLRTEARPLTGASPTSGLHMGARRWCGQICSETECLLTHS